jgi:hypothetical protein
MHASKEEIVSISREERRVVRSDGFWLFRTIWGWVILSLLVVGVISVAWWGISVLISDARGQGDATRQVNTGTNRLAQQAYFEDTYTTIKATDAKLTALAAAAKGQPASSDAAVRLLGAENYCQDVVGQYNAAAKKDIAAKFKAVDLPYQIDTTDPATDCEPPK